MMTKITAHSLVLLLVQTIILSAVESLSIIPTYRRKECSHNHQNNNDRRAFIVNTFVTASCCTLLQPTPAIATEASSDSIRNGKPFAPLTALLPVTRLKLWVDEVHSLSTQLSTTNNTPLQSDQQQLLLQQINDKLSNPPKLFHGETPPKRTTTMTMTAQLTTSISPANKGQYKQNRTGLNPTNSLMAMWNQADVERQWGILQYAESKREQENEMRAAFNFYTRQLVFSEEYVLTAPKEQRREMIRNDALPSVTDVIGSDLDRRDLYRNEFLTVIEDAVAEARYQVEKKLGSKEEEVVDDVSDLKVLVEQAWVACGKWFELIPVVDVEEAVAAVRMEDME